MYSFPIPNRRILRSFATVLILTSAFLIVFQLRKNFAAQTFGFANAALDAKVQTVTDTLQGASQSKASLTVGIVIASQSRENTSWIADAFPEWTKYIYVVDDAHAEFTVPKNKGSEGMVYLTHILSHYDKLPDITIFHHAGRYQWHNDDPDLDALRLLSQLKTSYVWDRGYANLRCAWKIGCPPDGIQIDISDSPRGPQRRSEGLDMVPRQDVENGAGKLNVPPWPQPHPEPPSNSRARGPLGPFVLMSSRGPIYREAFPQVLPDDSIPGLVQAACCAQFAVTAATVRRRSKEDYERMRNWLLTTPHPDEISGRTMEYFWHLIFGRPSIDCPPAPECYCKLYGLCDLQCEDEGTCLEQWHYASPGIALAPPQ